MASKKQVTTPKGGKVGELVADGLRSEAEVVMFSPMFYALAGCFVFIFVVASVIRYQTEFGRKYQAQLARFQVLILITGMVMIAMSLMIELAELFGT